MSHSSAGARTRDDHALPAIVGHGDPVHTGDLVDVFLHVANNGLFGVPELRGVRITVTDESTFILAEGDEQPHDVGQVGGGWWRTFHRH